MVMADLSSFFDTVRNDLERDELLFGQGVQPHVVRSLRALGYVQCAMAVTKYDVSKIKDMPNHVVQGGVFCTLGGKSILRRLYCSLVTSFEGIAICINVLRRIVYLLFADDGIPFAETVLEARACLLALWVKVKLLGLGPNGKTVFKAFSVKKGSCDDLVLLVGNIKYVDKLVKYLGLWFSSTLAFDFHVKQVITRANQVLGALPVMNDRFPLMTLRLLVTNSTLLNIVLSLMRTGVSSWKRLSSSFLLGT